MLSEAMIEKYYNEQNSLMKNHALEANSFQIQQEKDQGRFIQGGRKETAGNPHEGKSLTKSIQNIEVAYKKQVPRLDGGSIVNMEIDIPSVQGKLSKKKYSKIIQEQVNDVQIKDAPRDITQGPFNPTNIHKKEVVEGSVPIPVESESKKSGGSIGRRELIKKIMTEKNMKMIDASKYIKENKLSY